MFNHSRDLRYVACVGGTSIWSRMGNPEFRVRVPGNPNYLEDGDGLENLSFPDATDGGEGRRGARRGRGRAARGSTGPGQDDAGREGQWPPTGLDSAGNGEVSRAQRWEWTGAGARGGQRGVGGAPELEEGSAGSGRRWLGQRAVAAWQG